MITQEFIDTYLNTLDNVSKDEWYVTDREGAESFVQGFAEYLNEAQVETVTTITNQISHLQDKLKDLQALKLRDHEDYGELMTLPEWWENVSLGAFSTYDGTGYYAYSDKVSDLSIWTIGFDVDQYNFTHVLWFNK